MKIRKIFIIAVFIVFSINLSANAMNIMVDSTLTFRNIKIFVDSNEVTPDTEPFIYKGRTYIPARAVSEAMGCIVSWDDENNSISISNQALYESRVFAEGARTALFGWDYGRRIEGVISSLINRRNNTVLYKSSNYKENINEYKERLNKLKKDWAEFSAKDSDFWTENEKIYTWTLQLAVYIANEHGKNISEDKLVNAINYYNWALDNISAAHEALDKYDIKNDSKYLEEYAVCLDNAYKNNDAGMNSFNELENIFMECIYE